MDEEKTTETEELQSTATELVERLMACLKVSFLYPAGSDRVVEAGDSLREVVHLNRDENGVAVVKVIGGEITVNEEPTEPRQTFADWLRELFYECRLGGVALRPDLTHESLGEFTARLRKAKIEQKGDFAADWPVERLDVRPIDLMFRGFHRDIDGLAPDLVDAASPMLTEPLSPDSAQHSLAEKLAEEEDIAERLERLRDEWKKDSGPVIETARVDLMAEIARILPAEALRNFNRAKRLVHQVLDSLETYRPGQDTTGRTVDPAIADLHSMALRVAKRFFDVKVPQQEPDPDDDLPEGRPGDEGIQGDLGALLTEFGELPDATGLTFPTSDDHLGGELLGIYLHRLIVEEDPVERDLLAPLLEKNLADATDAKIAVLNSYLRPCLTGDPESAQQSVNWRIIDLLRAQGMLDVLQKSGYLTPELAATLFPEFFGLFLDSLKPSSEEDRERLRRAVVLIGHERMRAATNELIGEKRILTKSRIRMVLSVESVDVVPLIGIFAQNCGAETRSRIALLLRKLEPPAAESAALRAVSPELLPGGYLRDLCQSDWSGENEKLREYSLFLLKKFITDTASDASLTDNRVYAIRALRELPSAETLEFLTQLSRSGRLLRQSKSARTVRQAAARTIEEITDG
jgi:hypothetical protein